MPEPDTNHQTGTSLSLLDRIRNEDQEAWECVVRIYSPLIYFWCRRRCSLEAEDAADVMQEVFRSVYRSISGFERRADGSFRSWLWTISINQVRDHQRKSSHQASGVGGSQWQAVVEQMEDFPVADEFDAEEERVILPNAMQMMEKHFQHSSCRAFLLVTLEGYSAAEAGAEVGLSEQAVWQACYRIRRRLRKELSDLYESLSTT